MIDPNCADNESARNRNNRVRRLCHEASRNAYNHRVLMMTIPRVVAMISRGQADNMLYTLCCSILCNLAAGADARLLIMQQRRSVEGICQLLMGGRTSMRNNAASLLRNLAMDEFAATRIAAISGVVPALLKLIDEEDQTDLGIIAATGCLTNLCAISSCRADIVNEGGLDVLMKCTRTQNRPEVRAGAADCIANLALDNYVGRILLRARATQALFIMATHEEHACVWKSAGGALTNFAEVYPEKKNFVRICGLACLTKMGRAAANSVLDAMYERDNETPRRIAARRAEELAKKREQERRARHEARKMGKGEGVKSIRAYNKYSAAGIRGRVRESTDEPASFQY